MANVQNGREAEITELNEQFGEFLRTKGIVAKFKLAFENMGESARRQHERDVESFEAVKAKSREENREFVEFLETKGFRAKVRFVIESIKRGCENASKNTARDIARAEEMARSGAHRTAAQAAPVEYTAEQLTKEFSLFLAAKGLDTKYTVTVTEE